MTLKRILITGLVVLTGACYQAPQKAWSQEVEQSPVNGSQEEPSLPQLQIAGDGVGTWIGTLQSDPGSDRPFKTNLNLSDSALLLGASKPLFDESVGSFSVGMIAKDSVNSLNGPDLFLHQLFLDWQGRSTEWVLGRTNIASSQAVMFPTLRDDDLLVFTRLLNPRSSGQVLEDHRYANLVSFTYNQDLAAFFNFHAQHLLDGSNPDSMNFNSYGFSFTYLCPPGYEALYLIPSVSVGYEYRPLDATDGGASQAVYGGFVFNLRESVVNRVDLRLQDILTFGNNLTAFGNAGDTFKADANSLSASLRWHHDPFGFPGYQLALTAGYKTYQKIPDASSFGLAFTAVKDLGDDVELTAQYGIQKWYGSWQTALNSPTQEQTFQLGMAFRFETTFNRIIGPRRSLLNLQHNYIPN